MDDIQAIFLQVCGIDVRDVTVPHRLLRLPASERDAHAINQAASNILATLQSATGRIPPTHLQWMTQQVIAARNTMLAPRGPQAAVPPPVPPAPPALAVPVAPQRQPHHAVGEAAGNPTIPTGDSRSAEPSVVVRPAMSARSVGGVGSRAEALLGVLAIGVTLAGAGVLGFLFRDQVFGPGKAGAPARHAPGAAGDSHAARRDPAASALRHVSDALENLRKGFFDEADLDVEKALAAVPGMKAAEAMRLTAAYVRQYTELAEDARKSLEKGDVVDLGSKWGRGTFVEQDGETVTFRAGGKNKSFTIPELDVIPGARFRITAAYLDKGGDPANDLILGAFQFVRRLNEEGLFMPRTAKDGKEGPSRWVRATASKDPTAAEQARMLLGLNELKLDR